MFEAVTDYINVAFLIGLVIGGAAMYFITRAIAIEKGIWNELKKKNHTKKKVIEK